MLVRAIPAYNVAPPGMLNRRIVETAQTKNVLSPPLAPPNSPANVCFALYNIVITTLFVATLIPRNK